MIEFNEDTLRENFEEFIENRDIYKVDCGGTDTWQRWKDLKRVEYPIEPDVSQEYLNTFINDIEIGDIVLAQQIKEGEGVEYTFGFGVVVKREEFSDLETNPANTDVEDQLALRISWVTVADNGEHITADVPAEYPEEPVIEVSQGYFEDLLEGLDEESYPPEIELLVNRLFAGAARRNPDEIIDAHFPSKWTETPERARIVQFVVEEYLQNQFDQDDSEERRDIAIQQASTALGEDSSHVQDALIESFFESADGRSISIIDHALQSIEEIIEEGKPWENAHTSTNQPDLFLMPVSDEWLPHFKRTVDTRFEIDDVAAPDQLDGLGEVRVWGTKGGERNEGTFESISKDDIILYYKSGLIIAAGRIQEKFQGDELGDYIWDNPESKLVYTLKEYTRLRLPADEVWNVLDYDLDYSPQGFSRVHPDRTDDIRPDNGALWSLLADYITPELGGEVPNGTLQPSNGTPNFDLAEWLDESLNAEYEYFILKTGDDEYEDDPEEFYHFKEAIPGCNQLNTAAPHVRFVYLEDDVFYAVGSLGDVETEDRDGINHYFAEITQYHEIHPIPRDDVRKQLSISFPVQYGIISIKESDYKHILGENKARDPRDAIEDLLEEESKQAYLYRGALAHLIAGKNIVFYGPPGTGKTRAARKLSNAVCAGDYSLVTANAEWSNYQVVGGYAPSDSGFAPQKGFLTDAAADCLKTLQQPADAHPSWLLIDEMNRANLDEAFGNVFTLLDIDYRTSRNLSYAPDASDVPVPLSFRILATMNTYDKAQLFSLGYAFRRRFAFVRISSLMDDGSHVPMTSEPTSTPSLADLTPGSETTIDVVRDTILDDFLLGVEDSAGVSAVDVAAVLDNVATKTRLDQAVDKLDGNETLQTGSLGWLQTIVYFAQEVMAHDIIDIGQALLIDAAKYVIAHQLLFPEKTDRSMLDQAIVSYLVPQFEHYMPELRRAETIDQDSSASEDFEKIIDLANQLGLPETASVLTTAKEDKRVLE